MISLPPWRFENLSLFDAPNNNARKGRRNAISNKLNAAANAVASGDFQDAIDQLTSLLAKLDGAPNPPDWMVDSPGESSPPKQRRDADYLAGNYLDVQTWEGRP